MAFDQILNKEITHYEKVAPLYDAPGNSLFYTYVARSLCDLSRKYINPKIILDVGCGTGFSTAELARSFPRAQIYALDESKAMLSLAGRKGFGKNVSLHCDKARNIGEISRKFDLVFSSMSFHWFSCEDRLALMNCLREKGILALSFPLNKPLKRKTGNAILFEIFCSIKQDEPAWRSQRYTRGTNWGEICRNLPELRLVDSLCYNFEEEFGRAEDFVNILKVRGVLQSLFGSKADLAEVLLREKGNGRTIDYLWPVGLAILEKPSSHEINPE